MAAQGAVAARGPTRCATIREIEQLLIDGHRAGTAADIQFAQQHFGSSACRGAGAVIRYGHFAFEWSIETPLTADVARRTVRRSH
jgi:hypothetical protein